MASDWIAAAKNELDRLAEPHREKKRATVIALVDARLSGQSEELIWDREKFPNVCARSVYHGKWKKNALFMDVLAKVTELAQGWKDGEELRAVQSAVRKLRMATPAVADQLVGVATLGRVRRVQQGVNGAQVVFENASSAEVIRAAVALLDRAGIETAAKTDARVDDGAPRIVIDR